MTNAIVFALASDIPRLTAAQWAIVNHIIIDDGTWPETRISDYIANWLGTHPDHNPLVEDWSRKDQELL